jgi:hypothetical protein
MSIAKLFLLSSVALAGAALPAMADVLIKVDQSTQRMTVDVDGKPTYEWRVSSGRPGYDTPDGTFKPNRMDADHHSQEYDNAPMPHAIFFDLHGHAIHGSFDPVGHPAASHGCVRLDPDHAATLFDIVKKEGMAHTKIDISGDVRVALRNYKGSKYASRKHHSRKQAVETASAEPSSRAGVTTYGTYGSYDEPAYQAQYPRRAARQVYPGAQYAYEARQPSAYAPAYGRYGDGTNATYGGGYYDRSTPSYRW